MDYEPTGKEVAYNVFAMLKPLEKVSLECFHPQEYQQICDILKYCKDIVQNKNEVVKPIETDEEA